MMWARKIGLITATLALAGPAIAQKPPAAPSGPKAEVIHWWTSGGESAAVKTLSDAYRAAGGQWQDMAVALGEQARSVTINRMVGGNPPTAAQFNTSRQFFDVVEQGLLNNMDEVAARDGWDKFLPEAVLSVIKVKGHYYAAPVSIHMPTWIWYSKAAFAKAGIAAEPKTPDEFFAALDKLKAAGVVPLAFGGQPWQEKITFYAWLAHVGGPDMYMKLYRDKDAGLTATPQFKQVLASFKKLRSYVDAGSPNRNWNDATAMVISGKAGVQIMGDWAKGEFATAHQTAGKEFGCFPGFGPKSPYLVAGDVFVFPKTSDAAQVKSQQLLATVFTSPATQVAFSNKKGSIPIRTDVDVKSLDACAQMGVAIMKDVSRQLPTPEMLITPDLEGTLQDVVTKFWNTNQSVDDAAKAFAAALKSS